VNKWISENRQTIARLAGSLLAVILLVILLKEEGGDEIMSALNRVSIWYFSAGIFVLLISRLFVVERWHILLRSAGIDISYWRSAMLTFTGLFSSNFLPTTIGGDVVRLAGAMQLGYDRAICLASMVVDRLIGMGGMFVTLPFGLIPVLSLGHGGLKSIGFTALYQKSLDFVKRTLGAFVTWLNKPLALFISFASTFGNMTFIFLAISVESDIFCYPDPDLHQWIWCSGTFAYIFTFKIWWLNPLRKPDHCCSYPCFVHYYKPAWCILFAVHPCCDE
jgi:uncharacterized membrane protein YbhN (UPF0104 family)